MGKQQRMKLTRRKTELLYRKYKAILVLTNLISPKERTEIDRTLELLHRGRGDKIFNDLGIVERAERQLTEQFGVVGSLEELEQVALSSEEAAKPLIFVSKADLQGLFKHYERRFPDFQRLPPHARIGVERFGTDNRDKIEVFMLDASLFEDMAVLWNMTIGLYRTLKIDEQTQAHKRLNALLRATTKSAFSLIEGYLNSMSYDIQRTQTVSHAQKTLLVEWDAAKSRPRFLTLRDKILQYPKIALGSEQPPITENNCPELAAILGLEEGLRHSLIHPNPQGDRRNEKVFREQIYLNIEIDEVAKLCDLVVELISKIDDAIGHKFGGVGDWLYKRDETGCFPAKSFS